MRIDIKKVMYCLLCLMFLNDSSADVTKLRLNENITEAINHHGEVLVNMHTGAMFRYDANNDLFIDIDSLSIFNGAPSELTHIVKTDENDNDFIFDPRTSLLRDQYMDAVFCNERGEIVIVQNKNTYASSVQTKFNQCSHNKPAKAKTINMYDIPYTDYKKLTLRNIISEMQFQNIIRSGLIYGNTFNSMIYDNPFVNGTPQKQWVMPGISAFIKDGNDAYMNVYCAMKMPNNSNTNFWDYSDYMNDTTKRFYNDEHTERQLVLNHIIDGKWRTYDIIAETRRLVSKGKEMHKLCNGSLFIWTKGNPCTSASEDNGHNCCTKWYSDIADMFKFVNVYFSELYNNGTSNCELDVTKNIMDHFNKDNEIQKYNKRHPRRPKFNEAIQSEDKYCDQKFTLLQEMCNSTNEYVEILNEALNSTVPNSKKGIIMFKKILK